MKAITPKALRVIANLTDENDHTGARIKLARILGKSFDCKSFEKRLTALKTIHIIEGHLNHHLSLYRNSLDKDFFGYIESMVDEKLYKHIRESF